jgi:hypothetical protein
MGDDDGRDAPRARERESLSVGAIADHRGHRYAGFDQRTQVAAAAGDEDDDAQGSTRYQSRVTR